MGGVGLFLTLLAVTILLLLPRVVGPQAPALAAQKIADFRVPRGFRETDGRDLLALSWVELTPTDPNKSMIIVLRGFRFVTDAQKTEESYELWALRSVARNCVRMKALSDDVVPTRGTYAYLRRELCFFGDGLSTETEFGSFPGHAPVSTIFASGLTDSWDPTPIYALLGSVH
jgi:hypothetical protein